MQPAAAASSRAPAPPTRVPQWDVLHTLSHLCQRALFLAARAALALDDDGGQRAQAQLAQSRAIARTARALAAKATLRLDPSFKRAFCKRCATPLLPGLSATVRVLPSASHERLIRTQCTACGLVRRLPAPTQRGAASAAHARPRRLDDAAAATNETPAERPQSEGRDVHMTAAASGGPASAMPTASAEPSGAAGEQRPKLSQRARRRAARLRSQNDRQDRATSLTELQPEQASSSQAQQAQRSAKQPAARSRRGHKKRAQDAGGAARLKPAPAPRLPPFHERKRGSGWDVLLDASPREGETNAAADTDVQPRIAAALRALRGGHEIAVGIGPAGTLGPTDAPAQESAP